MTNKVCAILWDYGNVIARWSPRAFYETIFDDKEELEFFLTQVCSMEWHFFNDSGMSIHENIKNRQAEFPQYKAQIAMWYDNFGDMILGLIGQTLEIVQKFHAMGMKQYILTNMPEELVGVCFDSFDIKHYFADIIVSGTEKIAKPNREIFEIALKRMGDLAPNEVFFTDDNNDNIMAAQQIGFLTHLFQSPDNLAIELQRLGLLENGI